jgi:stalled ribosome rescue protein Dom34
MGQQVAVWMDGEEARVFHVGAKGFEEATIHSPTHHVHRHPKDQLTRTHNHPDDEQRFFRALADTLKDADRILILGPSKTKLLFLRYLEKSEPVLGARVVGLETADHPTDRQIAAHVRDYFESPSDGFSQRARP